MEDNDFMEIENPENYAFGSKDFAFSHQQLVFMAYTKVVNAFSQEMIQGFWEEKRDKLGNNLFIYHKDTRREAIETVKTLKNIMINDLGKRKEEIEKLLEDINKKKNLFLESQIKWWVGMNAVGQKTFIDRNPGFIPNMLTSKSPYYHTYIDEIIELYRRLFELLELCISDTAYFKREKIIG